MSFAPPSAIKSGGIGNQNLATSEEGIPLPWFAGIRRLKANWITQAWNRRARDKGRTEGEHWFANITAAFGYGPADAIVAMYYNGKYRNYGFEGTYQIKREDYPAYYPMLPLQYGLNEFDDWEGPAGRIHWGLDPQPVSPNEPLSYPLLFGNDSSNPRYWRVILVEWRQLLLGTNNPTRMPNIEATFVRTPRVPAGVSMTANVQYWLDGTTKKWTHGCQPVPAFLEFLTDKHIGFGMDLDEFDIDSWEAIASETEADKWRINPVIDKTMTFDAVVKAFCKYFDGYTYQKGGKLALGRYPDSQTVLVTSDYTEFTDNEMTKPHSLKTTKLDETINELDVKWISSTDLQYKEVSKRFDAPTNREARGEPNKEDLDLTWKLIESDVDAYARKFLQHAAAIRQQGSIWVRENRCKNPNGSEIGVGDIVFLDLSVPQLDHAYRVVGKSYERLGEIKLELETERGQYPLAYVAPAETEPDITPPEVGSASVAMMLPLTYEITGIPGLTVFPVMVRSGGDVSGATLHFKDSEGAFHAVADYQAGHFSSTGSRISSDVADEEFLNEFVVDGAGESGADGNYTKGADIGSHAAFYGPNGNYIAYDVSGSRWALYNSSNTVLYANSNLNFSGAWSVVGGGSPAPTFTPDLVLIWAELTDQENIIQTMTKGESENNTLLMVQGNEIYSVETITVDEVTEDYKIFARRARLGSLLEDHGSSGALYFLYRSAIAPLAHEFLKFGETVSYKLQPRNWAQSSSLADCSESNFTLPSESLWLPQITVNTPANASSMMTGYQYLGDDVEFNFDVTEPRGRNSHVSLIGYRIGDNANNTPIQDAVRRWDGELPKSFDATIEIPTLEWYLFSLFATNKYGTTNVRIWAYANPVPMADSFLATGGEFKITNTWANVNLPDKIKIQYFPYGEYSKQKIITIEGDAIDNLECVIPVDEEGTWQVYAWSYRTINGKEYQAEVYYVNNNVSVTKYQAPPQNGSTPFLQSLEPYKAIVTWDGDAAAALVGANGTFEYKYWMAGDDVSQSVSGSVSVTQDSLTFDLKKNGTFIINIGLKDARGNYGDFSQYSVSVSEYAEPTITSATNPGKYVARINFSPTDPNMLSHAHCWYWPNYANGFKEAKWAPYVPVSQGYIDCELIRSNEYRFSLYTSDDLGRFSKNPTTLSPSGGIIYHTGDAYPVISANGGNPILSAPNPYEFILYWSTSGWGTEYLQYRWKESSKGASYWKYRYCMASWGQMNQPIDVAGGVDVEWWIVDRDNRYGAVATGSVTIPYKSGVSNAQMQIITSGTSNQSIVSWSSLSNATKEKVQRIEVWSNIDTQASRDTLEAELSPNKNSHAFDMDYWAQQEGYDVFIRLVYNDGKVSDYVQIAFLVPNTDGTATFYPS